MQSQTRATPEYLRAFTRYLKVGKGNLTPEETRVLQEAVSADGGVLAPQLYLDRIAEIRRQGLVGFVSRVQTGKSISVPYFTTPIVVKELGESPTLDSGSNYGLQTSGDGSPFNLPNFGTSGSPDRRAFTPQKKGVYTKVTEELLDDSEPDLASFLSMQIAIAIYAAEANQIINGSGSSGQLKGIIGNCAAESRTVTAASATAIATGTGAAANDLAELLDLVDAAYVDRGVWLMHPRVFVRYVAGSAAASHSVERDGRVWPTVYGLPVLLCSWMPRVVTSGATSVVFGDLSQYLVAESKPGYQFAALDQVHIASGQIGVYARTRLDGNVVQPRAFAALVH
jgi:HK97 family phage major capsid protein